jgi:hypothetical protein
LPALVDPHRAPAGYRTVPALVDGGRLEENARAVGQPRDALGRAKGRDKRPAFDALCRDATQRRFDIVMAWSVDQLGRSLQDLVGFSSELHALHIDLFLHPQGLDTTTPSGNSNNSE